MNKTKIIATVGPSCNDKETLQGMVDAGVGTFRINMSHGDIDSKKQLFKLVKTVKHPEGGHPGILADLCGPKIRIVDISDNFIIKNGDTVTISNKEGLGDIFVTRWIWQRCLTNSTPRWIEATSVFFGVMLMPVGLLMCALLVRGESNVTQANSTTA